MAAKYHCYERRPRRQGFDPVPLSALLAGNEPGYQSADIWTGCDHGCRYCLPVYRRWSEEFPLPPGDGVLRSNVSPRTCDALNLATLEKRVAAAWGAVPPIGLSFASDPYPGLELSMGRARAAITLLHRYRVGVRVLTKSGTCAVKDFQPRPGTPLAHSEGKFVPPLGVDPANFTFEDEGCSEPNLGAHPEDAFGATLTFVKAEDSHKWEPRAAIPDKRMEGLEEAHRRGIPTWVSLNPVIDPHEALALVKLTHSFVDLYSVGDLDLTGNDPAVGLDVEPFSWTDFGREMIRLCKRLDVPCFVRTESYSCDNPEAVVDAVTNLLTPAMWAAACAATKPKWLDTTPEERDAALAEACLFRYRV